MLSNNTSVWGDFLAHFGFRTSMFGFKKDDVILYLEKSAREHSEKLKALEEKISDLNEENKKLSDTLKTSEEELADVKAKVEYYSGKEAEIEKMSVSIGTMYLVAKQNAAEVLKNAEACAGEIADHTRKQLSAANEVDEKLNTLKNELSAAAERFSSSVVNMNDSLENIKSSLESRLSEIDNHKQDIELICDENNL